MDRPLFSENWYRVRELKPALRSHVKMHRQVHGDQVWYMLEDPASGRFHRFNNEAYNVIALMNGKRSVDSIWESANTALGDDGPVQDDVIQLLGQLHRIDVLRTNMPPDVQELLDRRKEQRRARRLSRFKNPLSLRFTLFDPDEFLERSLPLVRWLFTPIIFWLWAATVVFAGVLAASHWEQLVSTASYQVLTPDNLLLLFLIYPFIKLLHELGHGYAARLEGGEVHELGVIFMVFVPVPYVDASAATAFASRGKRVMVGAAGIMVELFLASLALFLWLNISPGLISSICFNIMLIGGVSTLLFNGNPLLRFDGYYILADLLGIQNLGQRANSFFAYLIQRFAFGLENANSPAHSSFEAWTFFFYAPLALLYRLGILVAICLFLIEDLFVLGAALATWAVLSQIIWPLLKQADFVLLNPRLRSRRPRAILATLLAAVSITSLLAGVPVASLSKFEGVVYPPEQSHLISGTDGFVVEVLVGDGELVTSGQPLIQLGNLFHQGELDVMESRLKELEARYTSVRTRDRVQARLTREEISVLQADMQRQREKLDALVISAPVDGVFIQLPIGEMVGLYVSRGDLLGYVAPSDVATARVVVMQDDLDRILDGVESIDVRLASSPWESMPAELVRAVPQASFRLPSSVLATEGGGEFVTISDEDLTLASGERVFEFELQWPASSISTRIGTRVHVRFDHGAETLASQWYRDIQQLFLRRLSG